MKKKVVSFSFLIVLILGIFQFNALTVFADTSSDFKISNGVLTKYTGNGGDVIIPNGVTSIGDNAFDGCTSLTSVSIPNSVTSIGARAFGGCTSLTSVNIANSVTSIGDNAFEGCTSLTSISIPNSVTSIGGDAFEGCTSLTSVSIPNSVTSIGGDAFYGTPWLQNYPNDFVIAGNNILIAYKGNGSTVNIPNSVTSIGDGAFYDCTILTSVRIPNGVPSIGECTFSGCTSLTSVNIPNSVTSIGLCAFSGCTSLTNVNIPNNVTSIGNGAFGQCSSLTSVSIPISVTSIGNGVFVGTPWLQNYPNDFVIAGNNILIKYKGNQSTVSIPNSVTSIGGAFDECSSLRIVSIPNSVTSIDSFAFYGCSSLTILGQPNSYAQTYAKEYGIPFKSVSINYQDYKDVKTINSLNKSWTIKFIKALNPATVNSDNIYITTDEFGQDKVDNDLVKLGASDKEIVVNYDNKELWQSGKTYYLFITTNVKSVDNKSLENNIRMTFNVQ